MSDGARVRVAIVDYGTGNLYNVRRACQHVGMDATITSSPADVHVAEGVVLPGVGSMPDAMAVLDRTGLSDALRSAAERGTPIFGICLGMQLLMQEGSEFSRHEGLGLLAGSVVRFEGRAEGGAELKVPHIGWNAVHRAAAAGGDPWNGTPLDATAEGEFMYFVHSYHVVPARPELCAGVSRYGEVEFCSAVASGSVFGCQFHPERSGPPGLRMYGSFARLVAAGREGSPQ